MICLFSREDDDGVASLLSCMAPPVLVGAQYRDGEVSLLSVREGTILDRSQSQCILAKFSIENIFVDFRTIFVKNNLVLMFHLPNNQNLAKYCNCGNKSIFSEENVPTHTTTMTCDVESRGRCPHRSVEGDVLTGLLNHAQTVCARALLVHMFNGCIDCVFFRCVW